MPSPGASVLPLKLTAVRRRGLVNPSFIGGETETHGGLPQSSGTARGESQAGSTTLGSPRTETARGAWGLQLGPRGQGLRWEGGCSRGDFPLDWHSGLG